MTHYQTTDKIGSMAHPDRAVLPQACVPVMQRVHPVYDFVSVVSSEWAGALQEIRYGVMLRVQLEHLAKALQLWRHVMLQRRPRDFMHLSACGAQAVRGFVRAC